MIGLEHAERLGGIERAKRKPAIWDDTHNIGHSGASIVAPQV
jgi:hypothetical protein